MIAWITAQCEKGIYQFEMSINSKAIGTWVIPDNYHALLPSFVSPIIQLTEENLGFDKVGGLGLLYRLVISEKKPALFICDLETLELI